MPAEHDTPAYLAFSDRVIRTISGLKGFLRFGILIFVTLCWFALHFMGTGDISQKIVPFTLVAFLLPLTYVLTLVPELELSNQQKFTIILVVLGLSVLILIYSASSVRSVNAIDGLRPNDLMHTQWQETYEPKMEFFQTALLAARDPGRRLSPEEYRPRFLAELSQLVISRNKTEAEVDLMAGQLVEFFQRFIECTSQGRCVRDAAIDDYLRNFWYTTFPLIERMRAGAFGDNFAKAVESKAVSLLRNSASVRK